MRVYSSGAVVLALLAPSFLACGGSTTNGAGTNTGDSGTDGFMEPPPPTDDSGIPTPVDSGSADDASADAGDAAAEAGDHGSPSTMYPAFPVDVAQVVNQTMAKTLATPKVVTITWSTDPDVATYQAFGDTIGASTYWHAINSEYGVGDAVSGTANHVNITTAPPANFTDQSLVTFVQTNASNPTTSGWPAETDQTIYTIYMPSGVPLLLGGTQDACALGIGGYHDEATVSGKQVSYAVMPHCSGFTSADLIVSSSHELNEASTDPLPTSATAYAGFDQSHLSYEFFNGFQDELGDACEAFKSSYYTEMETNFTYQVQRQWSNKSAAAGHNPCVPLMAETFYNLTLFPAEEDTIKVDLTSIMGGVQTSKGFVVPLNMSRTFQVGFFSDAATNGPWTITANVDAQLSIPDMNGNPIANGAAKVTIDKTSGVNGEKAYVTVTPTSWSPLGVVFVYITSVLPGATAHHYMPLLISKM